MLAHIPGLEPDIEVIKLNVQEDHVHMVVMIRPRVAVADAVKYIKTRSAKILRYIKYQTKDDTGQLRLPL